MNSRLCFLSLLAFTSVEAYAQSYVAFDTAFVEPSEGLIKSLYETNVYSLGLSYGKRLESGSTIELGLARREYKSRVNVLESNISFYEIHAGAFHRLFAITDDLHFLLGGGAKLIYIQSEIENESTQVKSSGNNIFSFGHEFLMGLEWKIPGLSNAHLRTTIGQEHVYKSIFADIGLDSHVYGFSWIQTFP